jgi:hypothetical protein
MKDHAITLTIDDTEHGKGIWLGCECGYATGLGASVSPVDAADYGVRHHAEVLKAATAARQCWHSDSFGRAYPSMCEIRADWEATGPDGTTVKSCDEHLAGTCHFEGVTSVRMLAEALV